VVAEVEAVVVAEEDVEEVEVATRYLLSRRILAYR
jgi:hypothetical protein